MVAWRLGAAGVMPVDLLLWARWAILEGRLAPDRPGGGQLAPDRPGGGQRAPACSMGNMGSPFGTVYAASCGGLPARAWMRRDGVMGHMGHLGDPFLIATPLRNIYSTTVISVIFKVYR